jgi:hypothetical protein
MPYYLFVASNFEKEEFLEGRILRIQAWQTSHTNGYLAVMTSYPLEAPSLAFPKLHHSCPPLLELRELTGASGRV